VDTKLKQRLIGAIVLVALAVIFLPMLVKGPAPDSGVSDVPIKAPPAPDAGQFETRELPLVTPGQAPAGGAVGMGASSPAAVQGAPAGTPGAAPAATPPPASATTAGGDYAVSFGAYASQADADIVIARLREAKLPGFAQPDTLGERKVWRVRIGPYPDRAQAESVRLQAVKVRDDVNAQVVTLDAGQPAAPAATPVAATPATPAPPARSEPPKAEAPKPAAKPEPRAEARPETRVAETPAKPAAAEKPVAKPATAAPAAPKAPAAAGVGFAVQLGAFGNAAEADALRDKVRAAGFSAFVEQVPTDKGPLNRVRVGPVATRADAEQLKAQVAARVGVAGMVRPHP
jgi:cell division septation protein DedD